MHTGFLSDRNVLIRGANALLVPHAGKTLRIWLAGSMIEMALRKLWRCNSCNNIILLRGAKENPILPR